MGRKKNATSEMDVAEKQSAPLASRLSGLITDSDALRKYLDVSAQAVNQYKLGISRPSLENLCKIADFYNVSVDYLLGRTGTQTVNEDIQKACKTTGLSEEAVVLLRRVTSLDCYRGRRETLNALLKNHHFYHLLDIIFDTAKAISPEDEVNLPENDRFSGYSTKEVYESLAINWSAVVVTSTVDMLEGRKEDNGKH